MKQHLLALVFHAALLAGCSSSIDLANYDMEDPSIADGCSSYAPLRAVNPLKADVLISVPRMLDSR